MIARRRSIVACVIGLLTLAPIADAMASPPDGQRQRPTVLVLDARTGEQVWRSGTGFRDRALSVEYTLDGTIYGEIFPCPEYNRLPEYSGASFVAIDLANGAERWSADVPGFNGDRNQVFGPGGYANTFGVGSAAIVVEGLQRTLQGLHPRTGTLLWEQPLGSAYPTGGNRDLVVVVTPPADDPPVTGGLDLSPPVGGQLDARARKTGELRWTWRPPSGWTVRGVEVSEKVVVAGTFIPRLADALRGVDARTGTELWEQALPSGTLFIPQFDVFGSAVVLEDGTGTIRSYDVTTGRHLWDFTGAVVRPELFASHPPLLVRPPSGALMRLDPTDGSPLWKLPRSSKVAPIAVDEGLILFGARTDAGREVYSSSPLTPNDIVAIDAESGHRRWKKRVQDAVAPGYGQSEVIGKGRAVLSGGCDLFVE